MGGGLRFFGHLRPLHRLAILLHPSGGRRDIGLKVFGADFAGFSQALGDSFARYGFAVISDHGLPDKKIAAATDATKAFFALPEEVKRRYVVGTGGQRGYTPFGIETAKDAAHFDLKEFWHMGRDLPPGHPYQDLMPPNVWPVETPTFVSDVAWLYDSLDELGVQVLEAIANYLKLDRHFFEATVNDGNSVLRLLHYPPVPQDGPNIRAGAHRTVAGKRGRLRCGLGGLENAIHVQVLTTDRPKRCRDMVPRSIVEVRRRTRVRKPWRIHIEAEFPVFQVDRTICSRAKHLEQHPCHCC